MSNSNIANHIGSVSLTKRRKYNDALFTYILLNGFIDFSELKHLIGLHTSAFNPKKNFFSYPF